MLRSLIDQRLGRYAIKALLGRGGMAAVYRALDTVLQREVALKLLYPQYSDDAALVERFKREAVTAASLEHSHIVPIYDVGEQDDMVYFAMKLLHGRTLQDLLAERGALTRSDLIAMLTPVAAALDYAHRRGVVHRDVKPGNIFLDRGDAGEPRVMLTDFGIAKVVDSANTGLTTTGALIGTPDYMAPEQIAARPIDGRVDVYALGMVAFRALTGRRAFEGSTQDVLLGHLYQPVPLPSSINPQLDRSLDATILRAVARDPSARFATAGAFVQALSALPGNVPAAYVAEAPTVQAPVPTSRALVSTAIAAAPSSASRAHQAARPAAVTLLEPNAPPPHIAQRELRAPRRAAGLGWVFAAVLALALLAMSVYSIAGRDPANSGNDGSTPPLVVADTPTASLTETPGTEPEPVPSASAKTIGVVVSTTAAPSATTAASITVPPTAPPATVPPTAIPPTHTRQPTATATDEPTATVEPTNTPEPTLTSTATITPEPCPDNVVRGFGMVYYNNPQVAERLGCPTGSEIAGDAVEQYFEGGAMYWWRSSDTFYVFYGRDAGSYTIYTRADVDVLPEPPPPSEPNDPVRGFGRIYYGVPGAQEALGAPITGEQVLSASQGGALQFFERGRMIFTPLYRGEQRKSIFVLYADRSFQRYNDVFVE
jgi:serine/threonine-protein kinase